MGRGKDNVKRRAAVITIVVALIIIALVVMMRTGRGNDGGGEAPDNGGNIVTEMIGKASSVVSPRSRRSDTAPADTTQADDSLMVIPLTAPADSTAEPTLETMSVKSLYSSQQHIAALLNDGRYDMALMEIASVEQDERTARMAEDAADEDYEPMPGELTAEEIAAREEELTYFRAYALARMGHRHEALRLLGVLRTTEGVYKEKADTLYALVKN